jgi:hypothetical protein
MSGNGVAFIFGGSRDIGGYIKTAGWLVEDG